MVFCPYMKTNTEQQVIIISCPTTGREAYHAKDEQGADIGTYNKQEAFTYENSGEALKECTRLLNDRGNTGNPLEYSCMSVDYARLENF